MMLRADQLLNRAGPAARGHHPECLNVWNGVVVDLSTHDAGGVTSLDVQLARKMNGIAD